MPSRRLPLTAWSQAGLPHVGLPPAPHAGPTAILQPRHTRRFESACGIACALAATCGAVPTVCAVVLCVCGVLLGREGESGIAAGGTASLPGGGGIAAGTRGTAA